MSSGTTRAAVVLGVLVAVLCIGPAGAQAGWRAEQIFALDAGTPQDPTAVDITCDVAGQPIVAATTVHRDDDYSWSTMVRRSARVGAWVTDTVYAGGALADYPAVAIRVGASGETTVIHPGTEDLYGAPALWSSTWNGQAWQRTAIDHAETTGWAAFGPQGQILHTCNSMGEYISYQGTPLISNNGYPQPRPWYMDDWAYFDSLSVGHDAFGFTDNNTGCMHYMTPTGIDVLLGPADVQAGSFVNTQAGKAFAVYASQGELLLAACGQYPPTESIPNEHLVTQHYSTLQNWLDSLGDTVQGLGDVWYRDMLGIGDVVEFDAAQDAEGLLHLAMVDAAGDLRYAKIDITGAPWSGESGPVIQTLQLVDSGAQAPALTLDANGVPWIAYVSDDGFVNAATVPEPAIGCLLLGGACMAVFHRRRDRRLRTA